MPDPYNLTRGHSLPLVVLCFRPAEPRTLVSGHTNAAML